MIYSVNSRSYLRADISLVCNDLLVQYLVRIFAGWGPQNLQDLEHVSWAGYVRYRNRLDLYCTEYSYNHLNCRRRAGRHRKKSATTVEVPTYRGSIYGGGPLYRGGKIFFVTSTPLYRGYRGEEGSGRCYRRPGLFTAVCSLPQQYKTCLKQRRPAAVPLPHEQYPNRTGGTCLVFLYIFLWVIFTLLCSLYLDCGRAYGLLLVSRGGGGKLLCM